MSDIVVACLLGILGSCVSAAIILLLAHTAERRFGFHREGFMSVLTLLGLAAVELGMRYDMRWLAGIGWLLSAWLALLSVAVIVMVPWHSIRFIVGIFRSRRASDWTDPLSKDR